MCVCMCVSECKTVCQSMDGAVLVKIPTIESVIFAVVVLRTRPCAMSCHHSRRVVHKFWSLLNLIHPVSDLDRSCWPFIGEKIAYRLHTHTHVVYTYMDSEWKQQTENLENNKMLCKLIEFVGFMVQRKSVGQSGHGFLLRGCISSTYNQ